MNHVAVEKTFPQLQLIIEAGSPVAIVRQGAHSVAGIIIRIE
jgi:hypothetical protein